MLAVGAARGAEAAEHAAFDGRGVRREESVGGADLIVRVGVGRALAEPAFGERPGAIEGVVKLRRRASGRGADAGNVGPRLAEVVVDGDGALLEQQRDPDVAAASR